MANHDPRWWTGPIHKIQSRLPETEDPSQELAVVVTTGAFCPIHDGHIQMMETAKKELEARGMLVLGGYFCPDHDQYVSAKLRGEGQRSLDAAHRLDLCERAVSESEWLMVDRWATMYSGRATNYTRILDRISLMLAWNVRTKQRIKVVYAFGGDNAIFALSFVHRGPCVCVLRPGSLDNVKAISKYENVEENPHIIFSWEVTPPLHSTGVRGGDLSGLPHEVKMQWNRIQAAKSGRSFTEEPLNFYIRDEGAWAVGHWAKQRGWDLKLLMDAYTVFCEGVIQALEKAFSNAGGMIAPVDIVVIPLKEQHKNFQKLLKHDQIISLDPSLNGTENLYVSQSYKRLTKESNGYVAIPGALSLDLQIESLEPGEYILLHEDNSSAEKVEFVASLLPSHISIKEVRTGSSLLSAEKLVPQSRKRSNFMNFRNLLSNSTPDKPNHPSDSQECLSYVHFRDFLAGSFFGGQTIQLSRDSHCSAPLVLPYVRPHYHINIPVTAELEFSRDVWRLNQEFYASLPEPELCVSDVAPGFQELCGKTAVNLPMDWWMEEVCDWHVTTLNISLGEED